MSGCTHSYEQSLHSGGWSARARQPGASPQQRFSRRSGARGSPRQSAHSTQDITAPPTHAKLICMCWLEADTKFMLATAWLSSHHPCHDNEDLYRGGCSDRPCCAAAMRYRLTDKQKALTSFWQGWSVIVVKVLLEQMGWYSLLRVCAAGPCTCTICPNKLKSGCPAICMLKH